MADRSNCYIDFSTIEVDEQLEIALAILQYHYASALFTRFENIPESVLQHAIDSATLSPDDQSILFTIPGSNLIVITIEMLRAFFNLPQFETLDPLPTNAGLIQMLEDMGSIKHLTLISHFSRSQIPLPWSYLHTLINNCLTSKIGAQDQGNVATLTMLWAIAFDKHINFISFIWNDLIVKLKAARRTYAYRRFWSVIIHEMATRLGLEHLLAGPPATFHQVPPFSIPDQDKFERKMKVHHLTLLNLPQDDPVLVRYRQRISNEPGWINPRLDTSYLVSEPEQPRQKQKKSPAKQARTQTEKSPKPKRQKMVTRTSKKRKTRPSSPLVHHQTPRQTVILEDEQSRCSEPEEEVETLIHRSRKRQHHSSPQEPGSVHISATPINVAQPTTSSQRRYQLRSQMGDQTATSKPPPEVSHSGSSDSDGLEFIVVSDSLPSSPNRPLEHDKPLSSPSKSNQPSHSPPSQQGGVLKEGNKPHILVDLITGPIEKDIHSSRDITTTPPQYTVPLSAHQSESFVGSGSIPKVGDDAVIQQSPPRTEKPSQEELSGRPDESTSKQPHSGPQQEDFVSSGGQPTPPVGLGHVISSIVPPIPPFGFERTSMADRDEAGPSSRPRMPYIGYRSSQPRFPFQQNLVQYSDSDSEDDSIPDFDWDRLDTPGGIHIGRQRHQQPHSHIQQETSSKGKQILQQKQRFYSPPPEPFTTFSEEEEAEQHDSDPTIPETAVDYLYLIHQQLEEIKEKIRPTPISPEKQATDRAILLSLAEEIGRQMANELQKVLLPPIEKLTCAVQALGDRLGPHNHDNDGSGPKGGEGAKPQQTNIGTSQPQPEAKETGDSQQQQTPEDHDQPQQQVEFGLHAWPPPFETIDHDYLFPENCQQTEGLFEEANRFYIQQYRQQLSSVFECQFAEAYSLQLPRMTQFSTDYGRVPEQVVESYLRSNPPNQRVFTDQPLIRIHEVTTTITGSLVVMNYHLVRAPRERIQVVRDQDLHLLHPADLLMLVEHFGIVKSRSRTEAEAFRRIINFANAYLRFVASTDYEESYNFGDLGSAFPDPNFKFPEDEIHYAGETSDNPEGVFVNRGQGLELVRACHINRLSNLWLVSLILYLVHDLIRGEGNHTRRSLIRLIIARIKTRAFYHQLRKVIDEANLKSL